MRMRQFIAAFMILLSLTAQARSVLACGMTPAAAVATGCCPGESGQPLPAHSHACCDQAAPGEVMPSYNLAVATPQPLPAFDELPPLAAAPHWLPAAFDSGGRRPSLSHPGAATRRTLPLYLATARLRL